MEEKKLNLIEILKDCPEGTKLYSPYYGDVYFGSIWKEDDPSPISVKTQGRMTELFAKDGTAYAKFGGECMLFPSKEQRDWTKFEAPWKKKKEKEAPKTYWVAYDSKSGCVRAYASIGDSMELSEGRKITESKYSFGTLHEFSDFPYKIPSRGLDFDTFCEELKTHKGFLPDELVLVPHVSLLSTNSLWILKHYSHWVGEYRVHVTTDGRSYHDKEIIPYTGNEELLGCEVGGRNADTGKN